MKRLDLRAVPTWERPALVLFNYQELDVGQSLTFVSDHDPRPLIMRLEHTHPAASAWSQRQIGNHEWEILVTRIDPDSSSGSSGLQYLQRTIFARTSEHTRDALAAAATEHLAPKAATIYEENKNWPFLGFLCEGQLILTNGTQHRNRERRFFEVLPFEAFAVVEALDGGLTLGRMSVMSSQARYLTVPIEVVRRLGAEDPQVMTAIGQLCAQRARAIARNLTAQVSLPTIARVAAVLLPYAAPERGMHPALAPVATMTQAQLASAAGTVKEVAARAIAQLEEKQALRRERGHIRYLDRGKLLEFVV